MRTHKCNWTYYPWGGKKVYHLFEVIFEENNPPSDTLTCNLLSVKFIGEFPMPCTHKNLIEMKFWGFFIDTIVLNNLKYVVKDQVPFWCHLVDYKPIGDHRETT